MRRFDYFVKPNFLFFFSSLHSALGAVFCEGANYSNRVAILSNIINDNINPLMRVLGKMRGRAHCVGRGVTQEDPFPDLTELVIRTGESEKLL